MIQKFTARSLKNSMNLRINKNKSGSRLNSDIKSQSRVGVRIKDERI